MRQIGYQQVPVRPGEQKAGLIATCLSKLERLLEWLATYPPYSLGNEESGLVFDEHRAFALGPDGDRPPRPRPRA
jgi:hypothetical protein